MGDVQRYPSNFCANLCALSPTGLCAFDKWSDTAVWSAQNGEKKAGFWDRLGAMLHVLTQVIVIVMSVIVAIMVSAIQADANCFVTDYFCFTDAPTTLTVVMAWFVPAMIVGAIVVMWIFNWCCFQKKKDYAKAMWMHSIIFLLYTFGLVSHMFVFTRMAYRPQTAVFYMSLIQVFCLIVGMTMLYVSHAAYGCKSLGRTFVFALTASLDLFSAIAFESLEWPVGAHAFQPYPTKLVWAKTAAWICFTTQFGGILIRFLIRVWSKRKLNVDNMRKAGLLRTIVLVMYAISAFAQSFKFSIVDSYYQEEMMVFAMPNIIFTFTTFSLVFVPDDTDKVKSAAERAEDEELEKDEPQEANEPASAQAAPAAAEAPAQADTASFLRYGNARKIDSVRVRLLP